MPPYCPLPSLRRHLATSTSTPTQAILPLLESCKSTNHLKQLHAQIIRSHQISNTSLATKLLETCAISARNTDYALQIFNQIHNPNAYTWTTMIRAYVQVKNPYKAIEYYNLMRSQCVEQPNKFTYLFLLKAYSMVNCYQEGRVLHGKVVKFGFCFDLYIRNAVINLYSKCGDIKAAYQVFDEVSVCSNIVIWNTMIAGFLGCGDIENACELFEQMPERNVESWNVLISGYSKLGMIDFARMVFDEMPVRTRDSFTWSVMISSYTQCGQAKEALELFDKMVSNGSMPDGVTLSSVIAACGQVGALDIGRWIHAYVGGKKFMYDVFLGTSLVDMYAKCGCIDVAREVFNGMKKKNVCAWNAIICGLAMHGYGTDALQLYKEMEAAHVQPDDVTFVGVLSACCHIGAVDEGRRQFDRMRKEFGIIPKIEHYGCMVDILGRAGLIGEAKDVISNMPMELNMVVLGAFLNACKLHGFTDVGEEVVSHLTNLAPEDGGCYVLLSNIYADKNQWDKVSQMRRMMKELGINKKTPGCSSIEVDSTVHEFSVDDKQHSNWREVYVNTDRLTTHLKAEGYVPNPTLVLYNVDV